MTAMDARDRSDVLGGIALRTVNLTKRFGGLAAVDGFDLTVRQGVAHCIIGPNGAGKSTFFDLVTNVQPITAGDVYFFGRRINDVSPVRSARLGIGRKFQAPTLFPDLTAADNLLLGKAGRRGWRELASRRAVAADDPDVAAMLNRLTLGGQGNRRAGDLSHGQQQWLEIGVALIAQPRLILLDEPTAGMSPAETAATADLLRALTADVTTVLVEHDLSFVRRVADVVTVMHRGKAIVEGTPDEVAQSALVRDVYLGRRTL
jgi:urea transport system ATP-binding protein